MLSERRNADIYERAHTLAASGYHQCPRVIIAKLVADGYPEALEMLDSDNIRADLLRLCQAAVPGQPLFDRWRSASPRAGLSFGPMKRRSVPTSAS